MDNMDSSPPQIKGATTARRWCRVALTAILVMLLIGAAVVWRLGVADNLAEGLVTGPTLPEDGRPAFVATTYSKGIISPNATVIQRLMIAKHELGKRLRRKNPSGSKFVPSPVQPCSVEGLLNECMELTGTRYLIAREALGVVDFGHTNTLNGSQWVAAFEQALQNADMLLIRERSEVVKVIPKSKIAEYRKAGLVKADDSTNAVP